MATTAAVIGSGTASNDTVSETIVGSHMFRIDGFSATKDLGVGKCIKSGTFLVGGHVWYVECYPCGVHEGRADWVYLKLCRQEDHPGSRVPAKCKFTLMESLRDGCFRKLNGHPDKVVTLADDYRHSLSGGTHFFERKKLESVLMADCFHVRCVVFIKKIPDAPPPDLASGSHMLTLDQSYSKIRRAFGIGETIGSSKFRVGGHSWYLDLYPRGTGNYDYEVSANLILDDPPSYNAEVKVRLELTLLTLTHAEQIISSMQDFRTFSQITYEYAFNFLIGMEHESSPLLQDGIKIRCDIAVVNGITVTPNLRRGTSGDNQQVRGDVTFEVGGHQFTAHKHVLRSAAFMAEFFGPAAAGNTNAQVLRIDNMEPRVFEALLHFIYTDTIPEVSEEDKVGMAQGLLVAADRFAMETLKLICGDLLCSYINDARTAVTTLDLAHKHGCRRLMEACIKFLIDQFANDDAP